MAGGGVRTGITYGETDDYSYNVVKDPVTVRDFNATILHCLGIDHNKLTYKFQGLDQKLTGPVPANIVPGLAGVMKFRDVAAFGARMLPDSRRTRVLWSVSLALSISLLLLPFIFKFDGKPHADWQQFLGRFHPLAVHLPIGLLVLLPVLEVMGGSRHCSSRGCGVCPGALLCLLPRRCGTGVSAGIWKR